MKVFNVLVALSTLVAICILSFVYYGAKDEILALRVELKRALPIPAADFLRDARRHHLCNAPNSVHIAATDDFKVEYVYADGNMDIAILQDEDAVFSRVAFPRDWIRKGETIWWDIMDGKNILYHKPRNEVLRELCDGSNKKT